VAHDLDSGQTGRTWAALRSLQRSCLSSLTMRATGYLSDGGHAALRFAAVFTISSSSSGSSAKTGKPSSIFYQQGPFRPGRFRRRSFRTSMLVLRGLRYEITREVRRLTSHCLSRGRGSVKPHNQPGKNGEVFRPVQFVLASELVLMRTICFTLLACLSTCRRGRLRVRLFLYIRRWWLYRPTIGIYLIGRFRDQAA